MPEVVRSSGTAARHGSPLAPPLATLALGLAWALAAIPAAAAERPGSSATDRPMTASIPASSASSSSSARPESAVPPAAAAPPAALSFDFLDDMPGRLVSIGALRLRLDCRGAEPPPATVLFEPGLGGSALEWGAVADLLAPRARVCTYDRAGYGWSDSTSQPRHALRLAYELDLLLDAVPPVGPLVIVAHSFGGFIARLLAERRDDIAAMVLVDTSHEDQFARLEKPGGKLMMPRGTQFVLSPNDPPASLPEEVRRKVAAFGHMRKTYEAIHGEMADFRESAEQVRAARAARAAPFDFPVTVIARGLDLYAGRAAGAEKTAAWAALQQDLATLGREGRLVIAEGAGHHVHADAPRLVASEVERLLDGLGVGAAPAPRDGADALGVPSAQVVGVSGEATGGRAGGGVTGGRTGRRAEGKADVGAGDVGTGDDVDR